MNTRQNYTSSRLVLSSLLCLIGVGCSTTTGVGVSLSDRDRQAYEFLADGLGEVVRSTEEARYFAETGLRGERKSRLVRDMAEAASHTRRVKRALETAHISARGLDREFAFLDDEYKRIRDGLTYYRTPDVLQNKWEGAQSLLAGVQRDCEKTICYQRARWEPQPRGVNLEDSVGELADRLSDFYRAKEDIIAGRRAEEELLVLRDRATRLDKDLRYLSFDELEKRRSIEALIEQGDETRGAFRRAPQHIQTQPDWVRSKELLLQIERSYGRALPLK